MVGLLSMILGGYSGGASIILSSIWGKDRYLLTSIKEKRRVCVGLGDFGDHLELFDPPARRLRLLPQQNPVSLCLCRVGLFLGFLRLEVGHPPQQKSQRFSLPDRRYPNMHATRAPLR